MMTQEPMSSDDARAAILSRHDQLRGLATEAIHLADGAMTAIHGFEPLFTRARQLCEAFEAHIDFEERLLALALRDVIGFGSVLQAQVIDGHEKQRATLASAKSALEPGGLPSSHLVESVRTVAGALLLELEDEEMCLLSADLDAMATDTRGG